MDFPLEKKNMGEWVEAKLDANYLGNVEWADIGDI